MSVDAEALISRLSGPLEPAARFAFRHAAETALAARTDWGEESAYLAVVGVWRTYFHPPPDDDRRVGWDIASELGRLRRSKIVNEPPILRRRADAR
jgi:hypothetical protein